MTEKHPGDFTFKGKTFSNSNAKFIILKGKETKRLTKNLPKGDKKYDNISEDPNKN